MNLSVPCAASLTETDERIGVVVPPVNSADNNKKKNSSDNSGSFIEPPPRFCDRQDMTSRQRNLETLRGFNAGHLNLNQAEAPRRHLLRTSLTIRFLLQKDYH